MLIRSQYKTQLIDIAGKTIFISEENKIKTIHENNFIILGDYKDKENAMKVLDLIGQSYNNFEMGFRCGVFQMPKDEEVNELYDKEYLEDVNEE